MPLVRNLDQFYLAVLVAGLVGALLSKNSEATGTE
jgi:hypothetical protein